MRRSLGRLLAVARSLGSEVIIAEGIESSEDFDVIKELGIEYAQGYLLAQPV